MSSPASTGAATRGWVVFVIALVTLGLALRLGALDVPFAEDDYAQQAMLAGVYPTPRAPWDLYRFWDGAHEFAEHRAAGTLPWWADPAMKAAVFRPLASVLLALDHRLFAYDATAHHVHSLLWWVALCTAGAFAFRRLLPPSLAGVALIVFVLDDGTANHVAWLANRCAMISATFVLLAIALYASWRTTHARRDGLGAAVACVAALAAGEYGLAIVPYALAYELFVVGRRGPTPWVRIRATAPAWAPPALYLMTHAIMGYGYTGAAAYASPFDDPAAYLAAVPERAPLLLANAFFGMPAAGDEMLSRPTFELLGLDAWRGGGWMFWLGESFVADDVWRGHRQVAWVGLPVLAALVLAARRWWDPAERRAIAWLGVGAVISTALVCVAPAHPRLVLLMQIGASVLIAGLLLAGARAVATVVSRRPRSSSGEGPRSLVGGLLIAAAVLPLSYCHLVVDAVWTTRQIDHLAQHHARVAAGFDEARAPVLGELEGRDVIVVASEEQTTAFRAAGVMVTRGRRPPRSWQTLSLARLPLTIQRVDTHTIVVTPVSGSLLTRDLERFFRTRTDVPPVGSVASSAGMHATVLKTAAGGVAQVRVRFDRPLDSFVWLTTDHGLRPFALPPAGGTAVAPLPYLRDAAPRPGAVR